MKKKVFISVLTVTSMMLSCGRITTFAAENDTDIAVAESITEANITPQMIIGVWEGTYDGGTDTGELVKRSIVFNVTECSEDGSFGGVADVTSTEGERYIFSGNCDFKTGAVTMQGNEWIIDYNQWNFLKFTGTYDTNNVQVAGEISSNQSFVFKKTSDEPKDYSIDISTISHEWYGEYDGFSNKTLVRRNLKFSITEISDSGDIKGVAVYSPSNKADAIYALDGSYYFSGKVDEKYGTIALQGNEWIDKPEGNQYFVSFKGDIHNGLIDGYNVNGFTENGIWKMESTDILKGDLNFDNILNVADLVILQKYLLSESDFNKSLFCYADMNDDDKVNAYDLIILRQEVVKRP